jgi:hypothetical protein
MPGPRCLCQVLVPNYSERIARENLGLYRSSDIDLLRSTVVMFPRLVRVIFADPPTIARAFRFGLYLLYCHRFLPNTLVLYVYPLGVQL